MRIILVILVILFAPIISLAQDPDTLRFATYNLLNYPGTSVSVRNPYFRTVLSTMHPDVLVVQEMDSQEGVELFLSDVLNPVAANRFAAAPFVNGPDTDNALFYDSSRVAFLDAHYVIGDPRNIVEYRITVKATEDTIRLFSVHLKAGDTPEDAIRRALDAERIRERMDTVRRYARQTGSGDTLFILAGDLNVYTSSENAYQMFTAFPSPGPKLFDPIDTPGDWHSNLAFAAIHTQSPRVRSFGGGIIGGLDDRFDFILTSSSALPFALPSTYRAYGNDGQHFNDSINRLPNTSVPDSVATALHYASDHLPVFIDFVFRKSAASVENERITVKNWTARAISQSVQNEFRIVISMNYPGRPVVEICDSRGQVVMRHEQDLGIGEQAISIDISKLSTDVYLWKVTNARQIQTGKIIKN